MIILLLDAVSLHAFISTHEYLPDFTIIIDKVELYLYSFPAYTHTHTH